MKTITTFASLLLLLFSSQLASAEPFGAVNPFDIEFVTIGNPGNADDTTGNPNPVGKVDYAYRISKFEISEAMIDSANINGGLGITQGNRGPDKPATSVTWYEAAKFINWLNTSTNNSEAYKFDGGGNFQLWSPSDAGYDPDNLFRSTLATYFLPSLDEWYKAAYYNPSGAGSYGNYPTANGFIPRAVSSGTTVNTAVFDRTFSTGPADITQAGGLTPYGTMGQGGNVWEWEETNFNLVNDDSSSIRALRGGFWDNGFDDLSSSSRLSVGPTFEGSFIGFRVASIPEPSSALLGVLTTVGLVLRRRRFS